MIWRLCWRFEVRYFEWCLETRIGPVNRVILRVSVAVERLRAGGPAGKAIALEEASLGGIVPACPQVDQAGVRVLQFAREAQRTGRAARLRLRRAKGGIAARQHRGAGGVHQGAHAAQAIP
jgi:hypothetical protein